ncbi:MAG TPA: putative glycoside hydrolase [Candidatus Paceibacterota bacterium]|nr:putative glycoside hydrolase [Candidatus Paceibacterota bacterium]
MINKKGNTKEGIIIALAIFSIVVAYFLYKKFSFVEPIRYIANDKVQQANVTVTVPVVPAVKERVVTHIKTPEAVKAVYISSWVAGTPSFRNKIIKMVDETELNAIVIDVKDSTGWISFPMKGAELEKNGSFEKRIADVEDLIDLLHSKNIYVIARIAAFQDPALVKKRPDLAVLRASTGKPWGDRKGMTWADPGSKEVWDYLIAIGKEAYRVGFDELNFDYIRFPSDGNMNDISYRFNPEKMSKADKIREFFSYLNKNLKPIGAPLSADLFGMTMTNTDDLNIGQVLENALSYFDYVAPMVYPSHYPTGFHNYKNPATVPYEIVKISMDAGVKRAVAASTTPSKLRPWLQDFDMGATYTADMVRAQMKATYDSGLTSWMLWDPSNKYTPTALITEGVAKGN